MSPTILESPGTQNFWIENINIKPSAFNQLYKFLLAQRKHRSVGKGPEEGHKMSQRAGISPMKTG